MLKNLMRRKVESDQVEEINELPMYHLLKENTNLNMRWKISTHSSWPLSYKFYKPKSGIDSPPTVVVLG